MNDFNKEDLNTLFKCIRLTEMDHGECADLDNIKFKIQSMIDNYCEHELCDIDYDYQPLRCRSCKEVVE